MSVPTAMRAWRMVSHGEPAHDGVPDDLAGTILFLASEASAWISGQEIVVDGGMTSGIPHR